MREKTQHPSVSKTERQIKGKFKPRRPKFRKEEAEFGPGKTDILVCRKCQAFYWYKSWHHRLEDYPELKETKDLKYALCPACQQILDKRYEGEIILRGVPEKFKKDILKLVENFGRRAAFADPMDRIISVKEKVVRRPAAKRKRGADSRKEFKGLKDIQILTTENQLAKRLAKKINEIFGRKLSLSIIYSHQEDTVRIIISF
jgi:hypothetical protein